MCASDARAKHRKRFEFVALAKRLESSLEATHKEWSVPTAASPLKFDSGTLAHKTSIKA